MGSFLGPIASVAGGLIGGSAGAKSAPKPQVFQPADVAGQNTSLLNLLNQNASNQSYANNAPNYLNTFQQLYNSIYAPGAQTAANSAGQAYTATGQQEQAAAPQINAGALSLLPAAQQTLTMGFDPQQELYHRALQQLNDQVNVHSAQSGTTSSPYGASVANAANSNFNIDWQNQQLQRAIQSLGAAGTATGQAASGATAAGALGTAGAGNILEGGGVPYDTSQTIGNNQNSALAQLLAGLTGQNTLNQGTISDLMQYLGLGANQSNAQAGVTSDTYKNQLTGGAAGAAAGMDIGKTISSLLPVALAALG